MFSKPKLAIIDGTYYIFRAFYGIRHELTNKDGLPTNAIYGFKRMLAQLIKTIKPEYIAVVFDSGKPSFRNEIYAEYKAHRPAIPQELGVQFDYIFTLIDKLGYKKIISPGYEADDVIGTIAQKFKDQTEIWIVSADKDLTQLVGKEVKMYDSMRNIVFDTEKIKEKYRVLPEAIPDYLALVGDASDNIPGAAGIGPVTAAKLLNKYETLAHIATVIDDIPGKEGTNLRNSWKNIQLSRELTEIKIDTPIKLGLSDLKPQTIDHQALAEFYQELNFRPDEFLAASNVANNDKLKQQPAAISTAAANTNFTQKATLEIDRSSYLLIDDLNHLAKYLARAKKNRLLCLDLETTSLSPQDAKIVGIALKTDGLAAAYVPIGHHEKKHQIPLTDCLEAIKEIFSQQNITLIGQNIKYELSIFDNYRVKVACQIEDTILQAYLLEPEATSHSLDRLAVKYLNHENIKYEELVGKGQNQQSFAEVEIAKAKDYAAEDADVTYLLYQYFKPLITSSKLKQVYYDIELPLVRILAKIEAIGVKIDPEHFKNYSQKLKKKLLDLEEDSYQLAGETFNIRSPKELSSILFEKMAIKEHRHPTATGFSTNQAVLEKLAPKHPLAQKIIEYRLKNKLVTTYLDVLPSLIHPKTGRIHTSYNQTVAATGRLSSSNPNLQNIPIKGEERSYLRKGFVADEGMILLAADYSQIELRVLAHLAKDQGLVAAFKEDIDIHNQTAAKLFGVGLTRVDAEQRAVAKTINFGLIYGMGAKRLAESLNISMQTAAGFIKSYFLEYPLIKVYMKECVDFAKKNGYIETYFNRRRNVPYINSKNPKEQRAAARIAMNTPIQGTAADIIKIAMIALDKRLNRQYHSQKKPARMIMQIHDELVLEVPKDDLDIVKAIVKECMENSTKLLVPLKVSMGHGLNWGEAHS